MPGVNLVARETMNSVCNCSYTRGSHQMCHQEPHIQLSQEEQNAAEESLSVYCKPVELYNILQRRAIKNPLFLQRSLHYKIQAKNKRRIQISVSISGAINDGMHTQSLFPIYILLARPLSTTNVETQRLTVYRFSEACKLTSFSGTETVNSAQARFILPEISKLSAEIKSGSLAMLLVSCADITNRQGIELTKNNNMFSDSSDFGGYCLLGKIPMNLLHLDRSPNLSLGGRAEMMSSVSMRSCYMKLSGLDEEKCVSFQFPHNSEAVSILQQVPVIISAEELGAKDISAYDLYSYSDIPENSLSHIMRLRAGNVTFNYKYYNDMLQRTEVTEDFTCPFCLVGCASYKGLRCHLTSYHDLFRYEFWVNGDYQVVSVSVKTVLCNSEIAADVVDPRKQTFSFCHKPIRRWKPKNRSQNTSHVPSLLLDSEGAKCDNSSSPNTTCISSATGVSFAETDSIQSVPGSNLAPAPMLQFAKTRKLSAERSDPRSRALLKKRHFFHSHRAQPMAVEQVFAEQDSKDEVDDDVADLEDKRDVHNTAYQEGNKPFSLILPRNTNSSKIRGIETHNLETRYERLGSGMILLKNYVSLADQVEIVKICEEFGVGPGGFYQPCHKNGAKLRLHMMCFGRNWDPQTLYKKRYRSDGSEAPPVHDKLVSLVEDSIQDSQTHLHSKDELPSMYPDICIVNFYTTDGGLGLHQDRDESSNSLRRGLPVVSISIGDSGEFLYGHTRNKNNGNKVLLESGDVLIFGGKSRHVYHGVTTIIPNSAPLPLLQETMLRPGRLNLTLRQY